MTIDDLDVSKRKNIGTSPTMKTVMKFIAIIVDIQKDNFGKLTIFRTRGILFPSLICRQNISSS